MSTKGFLEKIKKRRKNLKELLKGKITLKELSEFFEISYSTLRNNKNKKLKELEEYCIFEILPKGIEIIEVKIPFYVKKDSNFQKIKREIPKNWNNDSFLDRKKEVAERIYSKEEFEIKFNTVYSYVCKASNELYGKPNSVNGGEIGNCHWVLCVRDMNLANEEFPKGKLRWFTTEEFIKKQDIKKLYFENTREEKRRREEIRESLALQLKCGDITKEGYKQELMELEQEETYNTYFDALQKILPDGCTLDYGIYVETALK